MTIRRVLPVLAGLLVGGAVVSGLAGCAGPTEADWSYPTARAARQSAEAGRFPGFLPADATDVRLHVQLKGYGAQLRWTSSDGVASEYCRQGPIPAQVPSGADWWPASSPSRGWDCGVWDVYEQDGAYYAWDTRQR